MGKTYTIHDQRIRKNSCKKSKVEAGSSSNCQQLYDYFTICPHNIGEIYWGIYPYFFRGLRALVWNRYAFLRSKMATFQTHNRKHWIKIAVTLVGILQLRRSTITVISGLYLNTKGRISKVLRKYV